MKSTIKHILISIGVGIIIYEFQEIMESSYLIGFLKQNLITIILALLAINTTTIGIVLSKIRELIDKENYNGFTNTKKQMMNSLNEQIITVIISIILFIVADSNWLMNNRKYDLMVNVLCISTFIYDLQILYDTSKSVFIIIDFKPTK